MENWIFTDETLENMVVVPGAVVIETGAVIFYTRVLERVISSSATDGCSSERFIGILGANSGSWFRIS